MEFISQSELFLIKKQNKFNATIIIIRAIRVNINIFDHQRSQVKLFYIYFILLENSQILKAETQNAQRARQNEG